jgi:hypothetical protein
VFITPRADALEALSAAELGDLCAAETDGAGSSVSSCRINISGFAEGAIATDSRVANGVADQIEKKIRFRLVPSGLVVAETWNAWALPNSSDSAFPKKRRSPRLPPASSILHPPADPPSRRARRRVGIPCPEVKLSL